MQSVQQVVVSQRIKDGYTVLGESRSYNNGLTVVLLNKGSHTVAINTLGYDEHFKGKTWKLN
jgi:hypothetical protein